MATEWDAQTYHRVSTPQLGWGQRVLARLPLRGDETVLDAGCGSGRLTAELLGRLPRGRVLALDASANMLEQARAALAGFGERVRFLQADLGALALEGEVDAVFSAATFHWVLDHDALFAGLHRALRPGGRLEAQCGGAGNLARLVARAHTIWGRPEYRRHFYDREPVWRFPTPRETEARLRRAGFAQVGCALEPAPARFDSAGAYREFLERVVLHVQLGYLPEPELRERALDELVALAGRDEAPFELDYVRLNISAQKAGN